MDYETIIELAKKTKIPIELWIKIRFYTNRQSILDTLQFPQIVNSDSVLFFNESHFIMNRHEWIVNIFSSTRLTRVVQSYDNNPVFDCHDAWTE